MRHQFLRQFGSFWLWKLCGLVGAGLIAVLVIITPWPRTFDGWFGAGGLAKGIVDLVTPIGTLVAVFALILNNRATIRTYEQAQKAEIATRFQKGAELLAHEETAAAGLGVMEQLALDSPATYLNPVLRTLISFISTSELKTAAAQSFFTDDNLPFEGEFQHSAPWTAQAIRVVGELATGAPVGVLNVALEGRIEIYRLYLSHVASYRLSLSNFAFHLCVFNYAKFIECDFRASTFSEVFCRGVIVFDRCDVGGVDFSIKHYSGDWATSGQIEFTNCTGLETATINKTRALAWISRRKPRRTSRAS